MTEDLSALFGLDTLRAAYSTPEVDDIQSRVPHVKFSHGQPQAMLPLEARLLATGNAAMTDRELLETLLSLFLTRTEAGAAAGAAMQRYGSLVGAASAPWDELAQTFSNDVALVMKALQAVGVRLLRSDAVEASPAIEPARLACYLRALLGRERVEVVRVFFLDPGHRLIAEEEHGRGTVGRVHVSPQRIARRAVQLDASSVIVAHNHPSGDLGLSVEDLEMTVCLREVLAVVDVRLHDHIVVSDRGWLSFRDEQIL